MNHIFYMKELLFILWRKMDMIFQINYILWALCCQYLTGSQSGRLIDARIAIIINRDKMSTLVPAQCWINRHIPFQGAQTLLTKSHQQCLCRRSSNVWGKINSEWRWKENIKKLKWGNSHAVSWWKVWNQSVERILLYSVMLIKPDGDNYWYQQHKKSWWCKILKSQISTQ